MNNLITDARHIPVNEPTQTISISPVTLEAPDRGLPMEMRITAPATGHDLPIILLSHGHGPSLYIPSKEGYGPLANFYAAHGFVVIQPTHVNSKVAGLPSDAPGGPLFWRSRVQDMSMILDHLEEIEASVPTIVGRLDRKKVAAVGHSLGGQTVGMLLGARLTDPKDPDAVDVNMIDPRIKVGVLLAAPGNGGDSLTDTAREHYSALNPDFSHMTTKTLVVAGDADLAAHLTVRGADWYRDPFRDGPGADAMLTLIGGKHGLGGVSGYDAKETSDEDPERLAVVQHMTWAYLRSALYEGDQAWSVACSALQRYACSHGHVEFK
ncbi:alpha/beta fold hydrolase [uncultured Tateyamaria sp.]|uniref:alpha/beta hydrolase family protein n=1 Tax=uncultured Tateyamaria sp. TaxID=455651 RepID=UPI00261FDDFA|nr:alpha/beta fold hydrolase [uncultured Tateyamaria sp.]